MPLNAYAVLDIFVCGVRLLLSVLILGSAGHALFGRRRLAAPDGQDVTESRGYLALLLGMVLFVLSLAAWPLLYLLLASLIPQWPGVMCIYGVTQIGRGSQLSSRHLPGILTAMELCRPLVVFLAGAWFVAYRTATTGISDLSTRAATLPSRGIGTPIVLGLLLALALASLVDSGLETAYLLIPKRAAVAEGGCCSIAQPGSRGADGVLSRNGEAPLYLWWGEAAVIGGMILGLAALAMPRRLRAVSGRKLSLLAGGAAAALAVTGVFLVDVAAPRLLGLPYHHCVYCLFADVPESLLAIAALVGGSFAIGWAGVVWMASRNVGAGSSTGIGGDAVAAQRNAVTTRLLRWGLLGYATFGVMMPLELALARFLP